MRNAAPRTLADHADDAHAGAASARDDEALVLERALGQALDFHRAVQARHGRRRSALQQASLYSV